MRGIPRAAILFIAGALSLAALGWAAAGIVRAADATPPGQARDPGANPAAAPTGTPAPNPPAAPSGISASDLPNDAGNGIVVRWQLSPDDARLLGYEIARVPAPDSPPDQWISVGLAPKGTSSFEYSADEAEAGGKPNPLYIKAGTAITVVVRAKLPDGTASPWSAPVTAVARGNWFNWTYFNILVATLLFGFGTVLFINRARSGKHLYIRPIPGISAVDEAIGRATEMGRPILFVLGTGGAGDIATIAGYTILARVAKRTAEYQTNIMVPVNDPVMMAMAQETVREAYLEAGRPDVYRPESIFYISAMQFPYVAAVNGLMLRERTATNFYMGSFAAESLLLAEAGSITGSIQISGTDQVSQIPFFVAATDYTLIAEELYAASAYLSQEPVLLGPLKAQDWAKGTILAFIILAVILWTLTGHNVLGFLVHTVG